MQALPLALCNAKTGLFASVGHIIQTGAGLFISLADSVLVAVSAPIIGSGAAIAISTSLYIMLIAAPQGAQGSAKCINNGQKSCQTAPIEKALSSVG
ncbi:MAG: hypothetical protein DU429_03915 [Candidatus Tokpelaia sp.]|nr:MAG: hypothetical protein DU430_06460 [Candidatus Tokpelaia sp.]KAA6207004.1 MAG: hypothetical protein DU429_03915 [Candidatus Tokpelaia sp.]